MDVLADLEARGLIHQSTDRDALAARLADFDRPPWRTREEIAGGDVPALNRAIDAPGPGTALFVADLEGRPAGCLLMWTLEDYFTHETHAHVSVIAVALERERRLLSCLSKPERETLIGLLLRVHGNLDAVKGAGEVDNRA